MLITATPSEVRMAVIYAIKNDHPLLLVGRPGIGKTRIILDTMVELNAEGESWDILVTHPVMSDPTDYKGLPMAVEGKVDFFPFADLQQMISAKRPLLVFVDDLGQAPESVQAALMQVILGRRIGSHIISPFVRFVAATNGREDNAGVRNMLDPLLTRFSVIQMETSAEDWFMWARNNKVSNDIIEFMMHWGRKFFTDKRPGDKLQNYANPRTIAKADEHYRNAPHAIREKMIAAAAGDAFAIEFTSYLKVREKLITYEQIMKNPKIEPPTEASALYATVSMLVNRVTAKDVEKACTFLLNTDMSVQMFAMKFLVKILDNDTLMKGIGNEKSALYQMFKTHGQFMPDNMLS